MAARAAATTSNGNNGSPAATQQAARPVARANETAPLAGEAAATTTGGAAVGGTDEEGFQQVRPRGWRRGRATTPHGGPVDEADAGATRDAGANGGEGTAGGEGTSQHDDAQQPTPSELHRAWQDEVAVARNLKAQGLAPEHPAMRAAVEARDAAERAWRGAKEPVPASVRLARAQAKLDRAIELQGVAYSALLEYESQHREKQAALRAKLGDARDRVSERRKQLEDIQCEVGAEANGGRRAAEQGDAARQAHDAICSTVAPTLATLIDQLDTSTPAWSVLNGLLGTLSSTTAVLEKAFMAPKRDAQQFDIADTGRDCGDGGATGDDYGDANSEWSESHEVSGGGGNACAPAGGAAASGAIGEVPGRRAGGSDDMDTDDWWGEGGPSWGGTARWQECGHGKWARSADSWADSWELEHGHSADGPTQPPAARRRLDPAPATPQLAGGTTTAIAPVDEAALIEQRKRQHNARLEHIVLAAIDVGIQPLTETGEELCVLDPHQLDAWVAEKFPEGVPQR